MAYIVHTTVAIPTEVTVKVTVAGNDIFTMRGFDVNDKEIVGFVSCLADEDWDRIVDHVYADMRAGKEHDDE